jgi:hypothetical protein
MRVVWIAMSPCGKSGNQVMARRDTDWIRGVCVFKQTTLTNQSVKVGSNHVIKTGCLNRIEPLLIGEKNQYIWLSAIFFHVFILSKFLVTSQCLWLI